MTINLNNPEAGAGKEICVTSLSPSITKVLNPSVIADEQGKAVVMINGGLPGKGMLKITVPGTDLSKTVTVNVSNISKEQNLNRCQKVTANVPSGTAVLKGTEVVLSTLTEGAEIYYTLDMSCPCDKTNPARIKYERPFIITEDVFIIAYAVKDGLEDSLTVGLSYTVIEDPCQNGHLWADNYTIDVESTCTQNGSKSRHCENCDATTDVTAIEKIGHKYENGICINCQAKKVNKNIAIIFACVIAGIILICVVVVMQKRKKKIKTTKQKN